MEGILVMACEDKIYITDIVESPYVAKQYNKTFGHSSFGGIFVYRVDTPYMEHTGQEHI